jgi:hypothetical protein
MKKILYFTHKREFWNISRPFHRYEYNKCKKDSRYIVKDIEDHYDWRLIFNKNIHAIFSTWHPLFKRNQNRHKNKLFYKIYNKFKRRFVLIHDLHDYTCTNYKHYTDSIKRYFTDAISLYDNYELDIIKKMCRNKIKFHYIPHHVETYINKDYGLKKIYDVTLYGSCYKGAYPFRHRVSELLKKNRHKLPIKINIIPEPGWIGKGKYDHITGTGLARIINQSYVTIATKSRYDYLLKKYFEISACKSLLVGDMPKTGKPIWKDNYVDINDKLTDQQILNTIVNTVKRLHRGDKVLNKKILTMYDLIHREYTLEKYYNKIYKIITG